VTDHRRKLGDQGEELAARWLSDKGYQLIGRNIRMGRKEIDIICRTDSTIVFVEVKTGGSDRFGHPAFRVDRRKRQALVEAAQQWVAGQPQTDLEYRFDVITVDTAQQPPVLEHRPAAFSSDDI